MCIRIRRTDVYIAAIVVFSLSAAERLFYVRRQLETLDCLHLIALPLRKLCVR